MAVTGLLHLSPALGFCKNQESSKLFKRVLRRSKLNPVSIPLSSCGVRQDLWILHHSNNVSRPLYTLPSRHFKCHSLLGGQDVGMHIMKAASMAFSRSFDALQSSPIAVKLVPAFAIIAFTVWGLGPLMRTSRDIFLHKNTSDTTWRRSTTHLVLTSYLQPILLWIGATLVCRAVDPIVMPTESSQLVKLRLLTFVRSLSTVLAFAYCLSSVIQQTHKFFMETNDPTDSRNMGFQFAGKAVYSAVWVAAVALFMELLGFSTQRWLTAGGLGTVLLTLAGREIFTNFLSSIMIHATRPFIVNEWIQTKIEGYEVSGTVEHVGWWSPTIIRGEDREAVHIPNHKFTVNVVRNLTQKTHWRIKTYLAISHLDVSKINNIVADMRKVLSKNPHVEQQKLHRRVFLDHINPENQALSIMVSCFVKTSHYEEYLCVKEAIIMDLLRVIRHHRARLATPIRTIQKVYTDADPENIPIFNRGGAASNRPLLLIEPPYKINGEEKAKPQARSERSSGDQDSRTTGQPTSDPKTDVKVKGKSVFEAKTKEMLKSGSIAEAKAVETPDSEVKDDSKAAEGALVNDSRKDEKAAANFPLRNRSDQVTSAASPTAVASSKQSEGSSGALPSKPSSALEENIVLGVALEGSKRTLPIEEELDEPLAEAKELAGHRKGNGTPATESDEKNS